MSTDTCLLSMPYSSITTPSLALGVLESYITKFNHRVDSIYGNLAFAKIMGLPEYEFINNSFNDYLLGEWTFSKAAFPNNQLSDDGFFNLFADFTDEHRTQILEIREKANKFI